MKSRQIYSEIITYIDELIRLHAEVHADGYYLTWDDLDEDDQAHLVSLFIEYDELDLYASFNENDKYRDIVEALVHHMRKNTDETQQDFVKILKGSLMQYYKKSVSELINERLIAVETEDNYQYGLIQKMDEQTGESYFGKF